MAVTLDLDVSQPAGRSPAAAAGAAGGPPALELQRFGVRFGDRVVLDGIDLLLPATGMDVLVGPTGAGKSTLLRSLAGLHRDNPLHAAHGAAAMAGRAVEAGHRPLLVQQHPSGLVGRVRDALAFPLRSRAGTLPAHWKELAQDGLARFGVADRLAGGMDAPLLAQAAEVQRQVVILSHALLQPDLLLLDEPALGLDPAAAARLVDWLAGLGRSQRMLVSVQHPDHVRRLADRVVLLAEGRLVACAAAPSCFQAADAPVAEFLRTGRIDVGGKAPVAAAPVPAAAPAAAAAPVPVTVRRPAALPSISAQGTESAAMVGRAILSEYRAPAGFHWIDPGKLAGCARPGVVRPIAYDLDLLREVGVTWLISLTETDLDQDALLDAGLRNLHLPIFDREAPSVRQAYMLVHRMQVLLDQGQVVAVHCKAGLGRTGTVFAAWLMREAGLDAQTAIARLRAIDRDYVQSDLQCNFLHELEQDMRMRASVSVPVAAATVPAAAARAS